MLTISPEIFYILERRVDKQQLQGYYGGKMNPDQTKFFAYTYVPLNSIDFEEYRYMLTSGGCSSTGVEFEKMRKFLEEGTYQLKTTEECIEEGIKESGWPICLVGGGLNVTACITYFCGYLDKMLTVKNATAS